MSICLCDTVTKLTPQHRGAVIVCGSHGGTYSARSAAAGGVRAAIFSDAGIGLDGAGIASLAYGLAIGMAVATVAYDSARIGDASDMFNRGTVSRVNAIARSLGCEPGMGCEAAARVLTAASQPEAIVPPMIESRLVIVEPNGGPGVILIDSAALIRSEDADQIVITGSHGGLVGNSPQTALRVDAFAACFHDAGVGLDQAGITRLPVLDRRGIAAMTVSAESARIGDALSVYQTGRISHLNKTAKTLRLVEGQPVRNAVAQLREAFHADASHAT